MKNILKSTTVLAAAGMVAFAGAGAGTEAVAAEPVKLGISGSFKSMVGYADQDGGFEQAVGSRYGTVNIVNDSEVHFRGNTVLDNGIRADVIIQLEADQSTANAGNATIDESYLKLTGAFGDLRLGSTHAANNLMANYAPVVGAVDHFDGDLEDFLVNPATGVPDGDIGSNDANKIVYFTPKIEGFQVGVSYAPSTDAGDSPIKTGGAAAERYQQDASLAFNRAFGDVDVALDAGVWQKGGTTDEEGWRVGGQLSYAGFTVGGSYADVENDIGGVTAATAVTDYKAYDLGASYKTGPYAVSVSYYHTKHPLSSGVPGSDENTHYVLGGSYSVGPGVSLLGTVFMAEYSDETTAANLNNEGWGAIAGLKVSF